MAGLLISECDSSRLPCSFVARPNRSISKRGLIAFFIAICLLSAAVAVRFWLVGAWVVLPITLLEMVVLGTAFFVHERSTRYSETIRLSEDLVLVTRQDRGQRTEWSFQLYWVQVLLRLDPGNWYPSRLFLRSHGRSLEIGSCLTDEERQQLSEQLKRRIERLRLP